ncbi:hypothetical protein EJ110_NYTH34834 [Nymphaea thermarum]|nr:hypothetical protein EJ110_NYTH34834 [Nymphaea thermarum]
MEAYRPLPYLYLGSLSVWMVVGLLWTVNTWRRRHFQELNPAEFNNLDFHEWHIGVPTGSSAKYGGNPPNQSFVIVQHPHASHQCSSLTTNRDNKIYTCFNQDTAFIDEKAKNNISRTA